MRQIYNLDFFNNLISNVDPTQFITEKTINEIEEISNKVSSNNYQKTPMFRKKNDSKFKNRTFKPTQLNVTTSDKDKYFNNIITLLNKLTPSNIDSTKNELDILIVDGIEKDYIKIDENIQESPLFELFLKTIVSNSFFINNIVLITEHIFNRFEFFSEYIDKYLELYLNMILTTNVVEAEHNYDEFCHNNKKNDKTKTLTKYFIGLINKEIISFSKYYNVIANCIKLINDAIDDIDKKLIIEEIFQNIIIICLNVENKENSNYKELIEFITSMSEVDVKKNKGITRKIIFKLQDTLDEINN
tara:strand:+ start:127 stop:1032 length:906 start_codon:yes stop_codon:yes gene_type:complete